jgi:hypothetical protein
MIKVKSATGKKTKKRRLRINVAQVNEASLEKEL